MARELTAQSANQEKESGQPSNSPAGESSSPSLDESGLTPAVRRALVVFRLRRSYHEFAQRLRDQLVRDA